MSFLHTVLLCDKLDFSTALVVCPLNTALNWLNEFEKWQDGLEDDEQLEVFHSFKLSFSLILNSLVQFITFTHSKYSVDWVLNIWKMYFH